VVGNRKYGRVEIFKRVGMGTVCIDPELASSGSHEVDVAFDGFSLKVNCEVQATETAPEKTPKTKAQALAADYFDRHHLEVRLSDAMQACLKERPDDPAAFIAQQLTSNRKLVAKLPGPSPAGSPPGAAVHPVQKKLPIPEAPPLDERARELLQGAAADGSLRAAFAQAEEEPDLDDMRRALERTLCTQEAQAEEDSERDQLARALEASLGVSDAQDREQFRQLTQGKLLLAAKNGDLVAGLKKEQQDKEELRLALEGGLGLTAEDDEALEREEARRALESSLGFDEDQEREHELREKAREKLLAGAMNGSLGAATGASLETRERHREEEALALERALGLEPEDEEADDREDARLALEKSLGTLNIEEEEDDDREDARLALESSLGCLATEEEEEEDDKEDARLALEKSLGTLNVEEEEQEDREDARLALEKSLGTLDLEEKAPQQS